MNQIGAKYKQLSNDLNILNENVKFVVSSKSVTVLDISRYDEMFGYKVVLNKDITESEIEYENISFFYDIITEASKLLNMPIITCKQKKTDDTETIKVNL